ncbi:MAG: VWA domain-containing protein, partial [Vicinamibacteria bacterium]
MTTPTSPDRARRLGRTLGLGLGLSLALLANLGDRAFSASNANSGIDPLQILDTAVKNNVLFFVDTSGSMAGTPESSGPTVGGDDPASRFYQMKRAVRDVLALNVGKANFGLATFDPDAREAEMDANDALIYVTQDNSAVTWQSFFNGPEPSPGAATLTNYNVDTCSGAGGVCTATEKQQVFKGLESFGTWKYTDPKTKVTTSIYPYPGGCTLQASDQVTAAGVTNPPIKHVYGQDCRYYLHSLLMRNGMRYVVDSTLTSGSSPTRAKGAILSSAKITCPPPPPGLLGDDVLAFADGTRPRACF